MSRIMLRERDNIVAAALRILKQKGNKGITVRNIAKELKCSTTPIYKYFESLEELEENIVKKIVKIYMEPIKNRKDYYSYKNMTYAFCIFVKNNKRLYEVIFLKQDTKNTIKKRFLKELINILSKDPNFNYRKDFAKLLFADGLALALYSEYSNLNNFEIERRLDKVFEMMFEK